MPAILAVGIYDVVGRIVQPWCGGNLAGVPHVGHLRALPLQRAVGPLPARVPRLRLERARVGGRGRIDEVANGGPRPVAKDGPRSVSACASVCGAGCVAAGRPVQRAPIKGCEFGGR